MPVSVFFDTNVLVYAATTGDSRTDLARAALKAGGLVSVHVLDELVNVLRHPKLAFSWEEVKDTLADIRVFCPEPAAITLETHESALRIAERYGYRIYDSLVIAAALENSCSTLYSEDMQERQVIEGLTIVNPFSASR
jgi:predicted nucleic acid-binding protein